MTRKKLRCSPDGHSCLKKQGGRSPFVRAGMVGMFFLFVVLVPTAAFAADPIDFVSDIPDDAIQDIQTTDAAGPAFLANPTTDTLGALSPSTISRIFNSLPQGTVQGLPSSIFSGIPTNKLPSTLQRLTTTVLQNLAPSVFSSLPSGTISTVLSGVSGSTLTSLSGSLFSGLSSGQITSALSTLSPSVLGSLPSNLFSSISPSTVTSLLSSGGLSSNVLSGIGGNLLGGMNSGALNSALGPLSGSLGSFSPSLFSSIAPSTMSSLTPAITSALPSSVSSLIPGAGGGGFGLFVPVNDIQLNSAFATYAAAFNTHAANMKTSLTDAPDSLRNIIASGNPGGVALDVCKTRDAANPAYAWAVGPWADAYAASTGEPPYGTIPTTIPISSAAIGSDGGTFVQINDSASLRCILQDLVGYQKMSLFVQIQQMLKQYISDAQQQELSNQLLNKINAANLLWAKQGEQIMAAGILTTEPVYVLNSDQSQYARNTRTAQTIVDQAAAQSDDLVGSLGLNWGLETATQVAINLQDRTEDPRHSFAEKTRGTLTIPEGPFPGAADGIASFNNYMEDANATEGLGAVVTLWSMIENPQNTPLGALFLVQSEADRRLAQDAKSYAEARANSGFQPTQKCSGLASDPNCDPAFMINVTSAAQNEQTVVSAVESGKEQIADSEILDSTSADVAENLSTSVNADQGGVYEYDTTALATSKTQVNRLIQELYETIKWGYYDLNPDQTNWAQAALLMIYDQMEFSDSHPNVVLPIGADGGDFDF